MLFSHRHSEDSTWGAAFGFLQLLQNKKSWNACNQIGTNVGLLLGLFIFPHFAIHTLTRSCVMSTPFENKIFDESEYFLPFLRL